MPTRSSPRRPRGRHPRARRCAGRSPSSASARRRRVAARMLGPAVGRGRRGDRRSRPARCWPARRLARQRPPPAPGPARATATATWSRRRGVVGSTFRSLRQATGEGYLGDLERIDVMALDSGDRHRASCASPPTGGPSAGCGASPAPRSGRSPPPGPSPGRSSSAALLLAAPVDRGRRRRHRRSAVAAGPSGWPARSTACSTASTTASARRRLAPGPRPPGVASEPARRREDLGVEQAVGADRRVALVGRRRRGGR